MSRYPESRVIQKMRHIQWELVKGGLNAIAASYWAGDPTKYSNITALFEKFTKKVEQSTLL